MPHPRESMRWGKDGHCNVCVFLRRFFFSLVIQHTMPTILHTLVCEMHGFSSFCVTSYFLCTKVQKVYCCFSFALIETGVLIESNDRSCVHSRYIKERSYLYIYGKRVCVCLH